jgi:ribonuclease HIII
MKKYLLMLALCVLCVLVASAQTFEGYVTWTTKSDIKMSDEQIQQMKDSKKQIEAQMNNPEFKKQMEKNPALKDMMEKQLKTMESYESGNLGSMLPEKTTTKVKGNNTATVMGDNIIIYRGSENKIYSLNSASKTYSELSSSDNSSNEQNIKITKTSETATINSYKCTKYIISYQGSEQMNQTLWVTKDIKDISPSQFAGGGKNSMNWFYKDVDGFPVKIEIKTPQGNISSELTELKRTRMPDSDFQIPTGYSKN